MHFKKGLLLVLLMGITLTSCDKDAPKYGSVEIRNLVHRVVHVSEAEILLLESKYEQLDNLQTPAPIETEASYFLITKFEFRNQIKNVKNHVAPKFDAIIEISTIDYFDINTYEVSAGRAEDAHSQVAETGAREFTVTVKFSTGEGENTFIYYVAVKFTPKLGENDTELDMKVKTSFAAQKGELNFHGKFELGGEKTIPVKAASPNGDSNSEDLSDE